MTLHRMKSWALGLLVAVSLVLSHSVAFAAASQNGVDYNGNPIFSQPQGVSWALMGVADATATQTFATTSYADLAAATVTAKPLVYDPTVNSEYLWVVWTADVTKATATSGTCAVYINGAALAKTARTWGWIAAGNNGTIGGGFLLSNSTSGSQTVKLQCKSGDTNVFTVNNAELTVFEVSGNTPYNP